MFFDPTHKIHNTVNWYCWLPKWEELYLPSNTGRRRISVLWAINPISLKLSWIITEENCDKEKVEETLLEIRWDYNDQKKIVIFLDNARYNRAYKTQEVAERLWIKLEYLPPYCPNLNLIERLWKFLKKKVVINTYYEKFEEFYDAIHDFVYSFDKYSDEVSLLFAHKMQIIKAA